MSDIRERFKFGATYERDIYRKGKLLYHDVAHNLVTTEGLDQMMNAQFHGVAAIGTWYCVMSETNTAPAAGMTYATPSFTETQAYGEGTRPVFNEAASSGGSVTNSANKAVFTINGTKTMYGAGLVGGGSAATTKGDTAGGGTLWDFCLFANSRAVLANDVINLTVTVSAADDGV